jgi:hypothetical protein
VSWVIQLALPRRVRLGPDGLAPRHRCGCRRQEAEDDRSCCCQPVGCWKPLSRERQDALRPKQSPRAGRARTRPSPISRPAAPPEPPANDAADRAIRSSRAIASCWDARRRRKRSRGTRDAESPSGDRATVGARRVLVCTLTLSAGARGVKARSPRRVTARPCSGTPGSRRTRRPRRLPSGVRPTRFTRRGRAAARPEWRLVTATHNVLKLDRHWTINTA